MGSGVTVHGSGVGIAFGIQCSGVRSRIAYPWDAPGVGLVWGLEFGVRKFGVRSLFGGLNLGVCLGFGGRGIESLPVRGTPRFGRRRGRRWFQLGPPFLRMLMSG